MHIEQVFQSAKVTIQRIRSIGNMQVRIALVGKQVRKIDGETPERRADPFVGVLPMPSIGMIGALFEKLTPLSKPQIKQLGKYGFVRNGESECQRAKLLACIKLGSGSKIPSDNCDLMKLAHLNRHVPKNLQQSSFSVYYRCLNDPPRVFQRMSRTIVLLRCFRSDFMEVDILFESCTPYHEDSISATEKGGINNGNDGLRFFFEHS